MTDTDSPWKELLEKDFPLALAFFLPKVHADLDWARDFESLDQELRKLDPGGAIGKRIVDRLFAAWTKRGGCGKLSGAVTRGYRPLWSAARIAALFLLRATPRSLVHHMPKENKAAILTALQRRLRGQRLPKDLPHPWRRCHPSGS